MQVVFSRDRNVSLVLGQETSPLLCLCGKWIEANIDLLLEQIGLSPRSSLKAIWTAISSALTFEFFASYF